MLERADGSKNCWFGFDIRTGEVIDWANFPPGIQVFNIVRTEKALKTYKVSVRDGEVRVSV